jgi:hypothetical protein
MSSIASEINFQREVQNINSMEKHKRKRGTEIDEASQA